MACSEIKLGSVCFATKKAAKQRVREILKHSDIDKPIEGEDFSIVCGLLKRHPDASGKSQAKVRAIVVRINQFANRARGFWVICHDGTEFDFSYNKCFDHPSQNASVKRAMRFAVEPQISEARKSSFVCSVTGERLVHGQFDIDHELPWSFSYLSETWLSLMGLNPDDIELEDALYGKRFSDFRLEQSWIVFHRKYARLRAVSRETHEQIHQRTF